jgi:uncharacterized protein YndB with AHSA1/START domain
MTSDIRRSILLAATVQTVWDALTIADLMKDWYFDLQEFVPEIGYEFQFLGGDTNGTQYNHLCVITEAIPLRKLAYSWKYEGYEGLSIVHFKLLDEEGKTRLDFLHEGVSSFPSSNPAFAVHNFEVGWTHFIENALPYYLNKFNQND